MTLETIEPQHVRGVTVDVAASALYESVYQATEFFARLDEAGLLKPGTSVPHLRQTVARRAAELARYNWAEAPAPAQQPVGAGERSAS